jgi:PAS domain-containing protein
LPAGLSGESASPTGEVREVRIEMESATLDAEAPKNIKQRLSQVLAPIQQLADSNIIGIVFTKQDGPIIEANDEFLRMIGYSRQDLEKESTPVLVLISVRRTCRTW